MFAGFRLLGQALLQWEDFERSDEVTWAEFSRVVMPVVMCQWLADQFFDFCQTLNMLMTQYKDRFKELS